MAGRPGGERGRRMRCSAAKRSQAGERWGDALATLHPAAPERQATAAQAVDSNSSARGTVPSGRGSCQRPAASSPPALNRPRGRWEQSVLPALRPRGPVPRRPPAARAAHPLRSTPFHQVKGASPPPGPSREAAAQRQIDCRPLNKELIACFPSWSSTLRVGVPPEVN